MLEMERAPYFKALATPLRRRRAGRALARAADGEKAAWNCVFATMVVRDVHRHAGLANGSTKIGGLMFRRPTYRPKGARTLEKARELVGAFHALAERSPWTLKQSRIAGGSLTTASPNGPTTRAQSVGEPRDLVAISVPDEPDAERVAIPCFVIFAPSTPLPRAGRSVSKEGGLIRFGSDPADDRAPAVK
jgi:hypothetical protein